MPSDKTSESILPPSPETRPVTSSTPRMLTNSEVESLLQHDREASDFARKAFSEMKAKQEAKKTA